MTPRRIMVVFVLLPVLALGLASFQLSVVKEGFKPGHVIVSSTSPVELTLQTGNDGSPR